MCANAPNSFLEKTVTLTAGGLVRVLFLTALISGSSAVAQTELVHWKATCTDGTEIEGEEFNEPFARFRCQAACRDHDGVAECEIVGEEYTVPPGPSTIVADLNPDDLFPICSFLPAGICPVSLSLESGVSIFIPAWEPIPGDVPFFRPGDWSIRFEASGPNTLPVPMPPDLQFVEEPVDRDGDGTIGSGPGEGFNLFFPINPDDLKEFGGTPQKIIVVNGTTKTDRERAYEIDAIGLGRIGNATCSTLEFSGKPGETFTEISADGFLIKAAVTSGGQVVPLGVADCDGDGNNDITVNWAGPGGSQPVTLDLSNVSCANGGRPTELSLTVLTDTIVLRAYDDDGVLGDTATAAPSYSVQTLAVSIATGIATIELEGSQSCILGVCWSCEEGLVSPGTLDCPAGTTLAQADFDDLVPGTIHTSGLEFSSGDFSVEVRPFFLVPGACAGATSSGSLMVQNAGMACGSGKDLWLNNVNARFHFGATVEGVALRYGYYGGELNIEINGDCLVFTEPSVIDGTTIGGVNVSVTATSVDCGILKLEGTIDSFAIGGQEFAIDDVEACDTGLVSAAGCVELNTSKVTIGDRVERAAFGPLGTIIVTAAITASNELIPLEIQDCDGDDAPDVFIPWSGPDASVPVTVELADAPCDDGSYPTEVTVVAVTDNAIVRAYDEFGNLLDSTSASAPYEEKRLTVSHPAGIYLLEIVGTQICLTGICTACDSDPQPATPFRRLDANADGLDGLADALAILRYVWLGLDVIPCKDSADVNDDGKVRHDDGINCVEYMYRSGPAPLPPFASCGEDPTPDDLGCESFPSCE